jgi:hypothetical protein
MLKEKIQKYFYYIKVSPDIKKSSLILLPNGYISKIWTPSKSETYPKDIISMRRYFNFLYLLKIVGIIKNPYSVLIIYFKDEVAHYSVILPKFFKTPFFKESDLQIGPVGTHINHRRKGLASIAIDIIINKYSIPKRTFWYITRSQNIASIKTCEKAKFIKYAIGGKQKLFSLPMSGVFKITEINKGL